MLRNGKSKRFLLIFTISLVTWHLCHAKSAQHSLTYCSTLLNDTGFVMVPDETSSKDNQEYQFYEVAYELKVLNERCKISDTQGLVIGFKWITRVFNILVEETAFDSNLNAINVSLRRGSSLFKCEFSPGNSVALSNSRFANFSCVLSNRAYQSSGQPANAIVITSTKSEILVNLANLIKYGSFGWLLVAQPTTTDNTNADRGTCRPPGLYPGQTLRPEKKFYLIGDNVTFVCPDGATLVELQQVQITCQSNGKWTDNAPKCLPKGPLRESIREVSFGQMGDELQNREFPKSSKKMNVLNTGGYFNQNFQSITEIRAKTPPEVEHATWVYVQNDGHHETIYICESGYYTTGRGIASYSLEHDDWIDVPECRRATLSDTIRDNWQTVLVAGLIAVVLLCAACFLYRCIVLRCKILRRRQRDRCMLSSSIRPTTYSWPAALTLLDEEGYVEPINCKPVQYPDLVRPSADLSRNIAERVYDEPS